MKPIFSKKCLRVFCDFESVLGGVLYAYYGSSDIENDKDTI